MRRIANALLFLLLCCTALYASAIRNGSSGKVVVYTVNDGGDDSSASRVTFTSTPVKTGIINQPYEYDPTVATTPPGLNVCFHLGDAPDGMIINDMTGAVKWTPTSPGMFEVEIEARICDSSWEGREQEYLLTVFSGPPGSVMGTVKDDIGNKLPGIVITLFYVSGDEFILS